MLEQADGSYSNIIAIKGAVVGTMLSEHCIGDTLDDLASRILTRDHPLREGARAYWLQNGFDLLKAKVLVGHGHFETWCKNTLSYSKSKAEKLMRAAEMFEPLLASRTLTDLPLPTLLYTLSAPSIPQVIRDEYILCVLAKENGVGWKLKKAIERHREKVKRSKRRAAKSPEAQAAQEKCGAAKAGRDARDVEKLLIEQERQAAARSAALALISARVGDDLPELLALMADAGSEGVFASYAESELLARARTLATPMKAEGDPVCDKPVVGIKHEQCVAPNETKPSVPVSMPQLESAVAERPMRPFQSEPVASEDPAAATQAIHPPSGKYGELGSVVSTFKSSKRGPKYFEVHKPTRFDQPSDGLIGRPTDPSR